jgi:hypothetical protein
MLLDHFDKASNLLLVRVRPSQHAIEDFLHLLSGHDCRCLTQDE